MSLKYFLRLEGPQTMKFLDVLKLINFSAIKTDCEKEAHIIVHEGNLCFPQEFQMHCLLTPEEKLFSSLRMDNDICILNSTDLVLDAKHGVAKLITQLRNGDYPKF